MNLLVPDNFLIGGLFDINSFKSINNHSFQKPSPIIKIPTEISICHEMKSHMQNIFEMSCNNNFARTFQPETPKLGNILHNAMFNLKEHSDSKDTFPDKNINSTTYRKKVKDIFNSKTSSDFKLVKNPKISRRRKHYIYLQQFDC